MPTAAELTVKINAETSGAEAGINRVDSKVRGFASGLGTLFSTAGGFVLGAGITAVVGGVSQLAAAGLDFEAQMANVNSIMQLSSDGIADLSTQVLQLAQNPGITQGPAELAAGLYNIASSGFAGADGLQILEASAISATAGMTNADTSARAITAALNAYGLGAENAANISDMMFQTVNDGVISFEQLANNLGNTLPVAASLGIGFDQLGAAYAQMTLSGVNASAGRAHRRSAGARLRECGGADLHGRALRLPERADGCVRRQQGSALQAARHAGSDERRLVARWRQLGRL